MTMKEIEVEDQDEFSELEDDSASGDDNISEDEPTANVSTKKRSFQSDPKTKGKKKRKTEQKVKPPTAEELVHLRETENLYRSNLMRLQLEELLRESKLPKGPKKELKLWIDELSKFLCDLPDSKTFQLTDLKWMAKKGIVFPLKSVLEETTHSSQQFSFMKPATVFPIGSFARGTGLRVKFTVDLAVVMPHKIFKKNDKLDYTYHLKRAQYLCYLAKILKDNPLVAPTSDSDSSLEFWCKTGDSLKPGLVIRPALSKTKASSIRVVLWPIPPKGTFKPAQFTPDKCNLTDDNGELVKSPNYNSSVLEDVVLEENETLKNEILEENQSYKDAVVLMAIWLKQRGLLEGYGSFNGHLCSMLVAYLARIQRVNKHMSSYQVLRQILLILSSEDWTLAGPSLAKMLVDPSAPTQEAFQQQNQVVFIDASGFHNLTFRLPCDIYEKVKHEARIGIELLSKGQQNSFQALFLTPMPFLRQYDVVISFTDPEAIVKSTKKPELSSSLKDYGNNSIPVFCRHAVQLIRQGLQSRLKTIAFQPPSTVRWDITGELAAASDDFLQIGINLNAASAYSVIDRGPEANSPEAKEFREFWGNKCELRRFKDSSVCESVVWGDGNSTMSMRRLISFKIINFVLGSKLHFKPSAFSCASVFFNPAAEENCQLYSPKIEIESQGVHNVFTSLAGELRDLTDLPLTISSVRCISPAYCFSDPFPPKSQGRFDKADRTMCFVRQGSVLFKTRKTPDECPPFCPSIDCVISLASTNKWPDDLKACRRLKSAFNIAIATALSKTHGHKTQITSDYIAVLKNGFVFRLHLGYEKEIALLKESVSAEGLRRYRDTADSIVLDKKFFALPKLTGALYGISQLHPGFGACSCLAKRWLSSQLLSESHFPSTVVDLLVTRLFIDPAPYDASLEPLPVFLRFLNSLATTNWQIEPVVVNFNRILDGNALLTIERDFNARRNELPPLVIYTPYDSTGSFWTKDAPTLPVLIRLAKLAAASLKIMETLLLASPLISEILSIFKAPMNIYDAIIKLNLKLVPRRPQFAFRENEGSKEKESELPTNIIPVFDFDPVRQYVSELEENYKDQAHFFYDVYGGSEIGVLFKPAYLKETDFKNSHVNGRRPVERDGEIILQPDKEALLNGFKLLGRTLVHDVELLR